MTCVSICLKAVFTVFFFFSFFVFFVFVLFVMLITDTSNVVRFYALKNNVIKVGVFANL